MPPPSIVRSPDRLPPPSPLAVPRHGAALSSEVRVALEAATAGANAIRASLGEPHRIVEKGVGDLVSEVDRQSEEAVLAVLADAEIGGSIISEESSPSIDAGSTRTWIVDPLDATSAFLFRAGDSYPTVLVALQEAGRLVVGVVVFPLTGEFFYSHAGRGAYKDGVRLAVPTPQRLNDAWVDMNQYGNAEYETAAFSRLRTRLRTRDGAKLVTSMAPHSGLAMRLLDRSIGLAAVVHDNNPDQVKQAPWDIAAPLAILTEAGGAFLSLASAAPIDPFVCEPMVVAGDEGMAREIIALSSRPD